MSCRCTNIVAVAVASCVFLIIAGTAASQYSADAATRTRHTIRRRLLQRRAAGVASSQRDECVREKRPSTDLLRLLPSPANADFHRHDGRCAYRYKQLNAAWAVRASERRLLPLSPRHTPAAPPCRDTHATLTSAHTSTPRPVCSLGMHR